jgi:hypothetical protein
MNGKQSDFLYEVQNKNKKTKEQEEKLSSWTSDATPTCRTTIGRLGSEAQIFQIFKVSLEIVSCYYIYL